MLHFVKLTAKHLQTRKLKLSDGRAYLCMLIEYIADDASDPNHPLPQHNLSTTHAGSKSNKTPSFKFAKGVIKMQNNNAAIMNSAEHQDCASFLVRM